MTVIRLIARPMLASMFVVGGRRLAHPRLGQGVEGGEGHRQGAPLADKIAPGLPVPDRPRDARADQRRRADRGRGSPWRPAGCRGSPRWCWPPRWLPTTVAGHPFWEEKDPAARASQRIHFFKNVSMVGGLLIAGVDTEGKPGVAWRARRAAHDVRREARQLATPGRARGPGRQGPPELTWRPRLLGTLRR